MDSRPRSEGQGTLSGRRQEIERRWAAGGLRRAAVEVPPRGVDPQAQARLVWLRPELERLGPVFSRFGRYLSTRLDHLTGADGLLLASLPDEAPPLPEAEVREHLRSQLGAGGIASLADLDPLPFQSLALSQSHRGRLDSGEAVTVKIARPRVHLDQDLEVLPALAGHLSSLGWPLAAAGRMITDFADLVRRRLDLREEAEVLGRLDPEHGWFVAPRVVHPLSTGTVLTLEDELRRPSPPWPGRGEGPEATGAVRSLADLWIHLLFDELRIPEELSAEEVGWSPKGTVALAGGLFQPLARADADALWRYVVAASRDDPDEVFEALEALTGVSQGPRDGDLRPQLAHVVPRRDGRFGAEPPGLPELLLAHWPVLARHGRVPGPALLGFYRGLVALRELAGPILSRTAFREALQAARVSRSAERLRAAFDPTVVPRGGAALVRFLTDLPRRLDRPGGRPSGQDRTDGHPRTEGAGEWTGPAVWLMLAASLVLWLHALPALAGNWTPAISAGAVILAGAALLRRGERS